MTPSVPPSASAPTRYWPATAMLTPATPIYSLVYTLILDGVVPWVGMGQRFPCNVCDGSSQLSRAITEVFKRPADLFRKIGPPIFPTVNAYFLLGWRPTTGHTGRRVQATAGWPEPPPVSWSPAHFSRDPRRCAGVLARCYGTVYLPDRAPDLSWDRLLAQPIAFDEPLYPTP